ncbi:MAG: hypothetical protein HZB16_19835 [Armatimonadetes bacterium]|nr:hypothetical protein [Armatimonadota bacterium]
MSRRALFTHNDLDALTCALLAREAMPDCDVFFCTYDRFPELVARRAGGYDVIWVADLSMKDDSPEMATLRSAVAEVSWFDHHASSDDQAWMAHCAIDRTGAFCSAEMIAQRLATLGVEVPMPLQTLLDYTHDQDLWVRALPESQTFNDILGQMQVQELFDTLRADPMRVYYPTDAMTAASERTLREREWSRSLAEQSATVLDLRAGQKVKAVCCWGSVSEVGDMVGDPDTLVVLVDLRSLDRGYLRFSMRTQSDEIDASRIAEQFGGGGHAKAAGVSMGLDLLRALTGEVAQKVVGAARALADGNEE